MVLCFSVITPLETLLRSVDFSIMLLTYSVFIKYWTDPGRMANPNGKS